MKVKVKRERDTRVPFEELEQYEFFVRDSVELCQKIGTSEYVAYPFERGEVSSANINRMELVHRVRKLVAKL